MRDIFILDDLDLWALSYLLLNNFVTIVHFKRLGSRVSYDSFNQYVLFFSNNVHTAKQMQYTLEAILSDF